VEDSGDGVGVGDDLEDTHAAAAFSAAGDVDGEDVGCYAHREAQLIAGLAIDRLGGRDEAIARLQAAAAPVKPVRPRSRRPSTPREELDAVVQARARTELARRGVRARRSQAG
jgi:hypothetical protein